MIEQNNVSSLDSARRKLVRGTFAAPAVLTLQCGSAFAAVSSTSLARQAQLQQTVATPADTAYFRYQLWVIRKKTDNTIVSSWIKGDDLTAFKKTAQVPFVPPGAWWQFDPTTNSLLGSSTTTAPSPNGSQNPLEQTGAYVALRVSANGALVGAGASSPGGAGGAVNASVWNSFALATI